MKTGVMKTDIRGGGSRFPYGPFDMTETRLDACERIADE